MTVTLVGPHDYAGSVINRSLRLFDLHSLVRRDFLRASDYYRALAYLSLIIGASRSGFRQGDNYVHMDYSPAEHKKRDGQSFKGLEDFLGYTGMDVMFDSRLKELQQKFAARKPEQKAVMIAVINAGDGKLISGIKQHLSQRYGLDSVVVGTNKDISLAGFKEADGMYVIARPGRLEHVVHSREMGEPRIMASVPDAMPKKDSLANEWYGMVPDSFHIVISPWILGPGEPWKQENMLANVHEASKLLKKDGMMIAVGPKVVEGYPKEISDPGLMEIVLPERMRRIAKDTREARAENTVYVR
ncbi:hypothetical protein J4227_07135 [Candidatus Woesearchaeota archaeon]|nr:hypothetical protein [Candidatus Woesearchaeota archaeon]